MPSLNIKDYIIAILLLATIGLSITTVIIKTNLNIKANIIEQQQALAEAHKIKIALLKEHSEKTKEYLDEKYTVQFDTLNNVISRLHSEREKSILPTIPKSSTDPKGICFKREDLDKAINGYRDGVQELVRKGSEAIIGLNIAREWVEEEKALYDEQ